MIDHYRIFLADPDPMFREGVKKIIERSGDLRVVGQAGDVIQLPEMIRKTTPDLIVMDISLPNCWGLDTIREISEFHPGIKVLILTTKKKREIVLNAFHNHADGYLLKEDDEEEFFTAIRQIRQGDFYLSPNFSRTLTGDFINM